MERLGLLLSGGVGIAVGAIAAGLYCRLSYKQKIAKLEHQLTSAKNSSIKIENERRKIEAQYLSLKQNQSDLENKQQDLEREFNQLQKAHQQVLARQDLEIKSRYPTVDSTSDGVTHLPTSKTSSAESSVHKLLQVYQTNSKSLLVEARVTEAPESIIQRRSNPNLVPNLIESGNFDYLIVKDEENTNQYWLFPKTTLKVNQYEYETIEALFNCHNYQNRPSTFQVHKPASMVRNYASSSWQPIEKGELEFV
jgi:exonuclease VII large subunit